MTRTQMISNYLSDVCKLKEVLPSRSRKYRMFGPSKSGCYYFVGKSGALRVGKNIADSHSMTDTQIYRNILLHEALHAKKKENKK